MNDIGPIGRIQKRRAAIATLKLLAHEAAHCVVIHYSCESFDGEGARKSPRITSIAVQNLASGQTTSFSISIMAEIRKLPHDEIIRHYDELERAMLKEFYEYMKMHLSYKWIHWAMRDANYGFSALEHRCRILGEEVHRISEQNLFDLHMLLKDKYSRSYMENPRLVNLIDKNEFSKRDFLSGKDEAEAFENQDYWRMHRSTLRKVHNIANIFNHAASDTLRHNARWQDIWGLDISGLVTLVKEHWIVTCIVILGSVFTLIVRFSDVWKLMNRHS